ncbi:YdcF family protein [Azospirillum sp. YIM B02556]|uniref:YdcF family protein n=1 Tax=Azospirillum endophyticum TaxID=2800326 RepID=A0ABS1F5Z5_9PROT|nr:YdcF family protein [Azospirillum endophyticum]MBK1838818.1 YdcF family protein [Azospirillum endophyticum]
MSVLYRRRGGVMARAVGHLIAGALALAVAWLVGLFWYAADVPRSSPTGADAERATDAIVVLTGGSNRLRTGLELLAAGRARKLFVSGVYDGVEVQELLKLSRHSPTEMECCITLGYSADSTIGNAYETSDWMRDQGFRSLRLVTANYHMRRSLLELSMAMPDVDLVPHPVVAPTVHLDDWWMWPGTANLLINEYNKLLVAGARWMLRRVVRD